MKKELRQDLQFTGLFSMALALIIGGLVLTADLIKKQNDQNTIHSARAHVNFQANVVAL